MQTYDTRIWVAVNPSNVTLWLPAEQIKTSRFIKDRCTESSPQTCYYNLRALTVTTN
jgi:hypothetical protein